MQINLQEKKKDFQKTQNKKVKYNRDRTRIACVEAQTHNLHTKQTWFQISPQNW